MGRKIFILDGAHVALLYDDTGYCEFDFPEWANRVLEKLILDAFKYGIPIIFELSPSSLKFLVERRYSDIVSLIKTGLEKKLVEIVNGTYNLPYLSIIGYESNIQQFYYGLKEFEKMFGVRPIIYAHTEYAIHPQLPQILVKFGYKYASIRVRLNGSAPQIDAEKVLWMSLDGSMIETLPAYKSILFGEQLGGKFYKELEKMVEIAEKNRDIKYIALNHFEDFIYPVWDREKYYKKYRDGKLPYRYSRYIDFFTSTPKSKTIFKPRWIEYRFKIIKYYPNTLYHVRKAEYRLIAAETLAALMGIKLNTLEELWRKLLDAQAHDCYVVPDSYEGEYMENRRHVYGEYLGPKVFLKAGYKAEQLAVYVENNSESIIRRILEEKLYVPDTEEKVIVFNPFGWRASLIYRFIPPYIWNYSSLKSPDGLEIPLQFEKQGWLKVATFIHKLNPYSIQVLTPLKQSLNDKIDSKINLKKKGILIRIDDIDIEFSLNNEKIVKMDEKSRGAVYNKYLCSLKDKSMIKIIELKDEIMFYINIHKPSNLTIRVDKCSKIFVDYPFGIEDVEGETHFTSLTLFKINGKYIVVSSLNIHFLKACPNKGEAIFHLPREGPYFLKIMSTSSKTESIRRTFEYGLEYMSPHIFPCRNEKIRLLNISTNAIPIALRLIQNGILLRIMGTDIETFLKCRDKKIYEADMFGREVNSIRRDEVTIKPWEIKTLILR